MSEKVYTDLEISRTILKEAIEKGITCAGNHATTHNMVNHPSHYNHGKYEPVNVIADWDLNFNLGNVIKYVARCDHKGRKLEDLKKARQYLDFEIQRLEDQERVRMVNGTDWRD